jgi:Arc/MetJ-type ribon-helix-helix transcriptional regulator
MKLELPSRIQKSIQQRVKSGKYRRPEDVVAAAIVSLDQQDAIGDFTVGELDRLLKAGERDIASGDVIDADRAFAELRRVAARKQKKAG